MQDYRVFITGTQSISLLRAAREGKMVGARPAPVSHLDLAPRVTSLSELGIDSLLDALAISQKNPLTVCVPSRDRRVWATGSKSVIRQATLPPSSFLELVPGSGSAALRFPASTHVYIEAPGLALVSLCQMLRDKTGKGEVDKLTAFLRALEFADECCGSYSRDMMRPMAAGAHFDAPGTDSRLVNLDELRRWIDEAEDIKCLKMARKVARHTIDLSGSPMETYINHGLTLPPRLGGLSMPQLIANAQLDTTSQVRSRLRHKSLRPDFQWAMYHTLAEYLGDKDHAAKPARVEDKNRLQDYTMAGYRAFFLMFDDVKSVAALNRTAQMLARSLMENGAKGELYRLRKCIKAPGQAERQVTLVKTLLPPLLRYNESDAS